MNSDLFDDAMGNEPQHLAPGVVLLPRYANASESAVLNGIDEVMRRAPLRHMVTSRGFHMSVAMTNAGPRGWVSDRRGYRYSAVDPETQQPWPDLPIALRELAQSAALAAGFPHFQPDACLINRYVPGARMSLHQDRDEADFSQPIVSVSLGLPATFQLGGLQRQDKTQRISLEHGDVLVWGGPARLRFHGVLPLKAGVHPLLGEQRINLTFRRAH